MTYRIALERLRAYEQRELIAGEYRATTSSGWWCGCAVGAIAPETGDVGSTPVELLLDDKLLSYFPEFVRPAVESLRSTGMTQSEASELVAVNDSFVGTRAERYAHVLAWLETQVAREVDDG